MHPGPRSCQHASEARPSCSITGSTLDLIHAKHPRPLSGIESRSRLPRMTRPASGHPAIPHDRTRADERESSIHGSEASEARPSALPVLRASCTCGCIGACTPAPGAANMRDPASLLDHKQFTLDRIPGRHRRCPSCPSPWTHAKDAPAQELLTCKSCDRIRPMRTDHTNIEVQSAA